MAPRQERRVKEKTYEQGIVEEQIKTLAATNVTQNKRMDKADESLILYKQSMALYQKAINKRLDVMSLATYTLIIVAVMVTFKPELAASVPAVLGVIGG